MRELHHPPRECLELTQVLHALSDPIRLCIVRQLANCGDLPCGTFCETAPKSTMSHHFKVLRLAGVLWQRPEGTSCYNTLRRADLDARFPGLLCAIVGVAGADLDENCEPCAGESDRDEASETDFSRRDGLK